MPESSRGNESLSSLNDKGRELCAGLAPSPDIDVTLSLSHLSPAQSVNFIPSFSNSLISTPLTSLSLSPVRLLEPFERDSEHYFGERLLTARKFEAEIGALGRRRGFKGAPLFTQATSKYSPFFSPQNLSSQSPISSTPTNPRPFSPRTPLSTVTNMIRSVSSAKPVNLAKEIDLQQLFDQGDPFAVSTDSFFAPSLSSDDLPSVNLDNFGQYHPCDSLHSRTPSLKRKSNFGDLRTAASPVKKFGMRTTIYDMSRSSLYRKSTPADSREKLSSRLLNQEVCASPTIILTVPSAPSSPTKGNGIAKSALDSGTKVNITTQANTWPLEISYSDASEASPPALLPVAPPTFHTDDLLSGRGSPILEEIISFNHGVSHIGDTDRDVVTCVLDVNKTSTTTRSTEILVHDPPSGQLPYQDVPIDISMTSTTPWVKTDTNDGFYCTLDLSQDLVPLEDLYDFDVYDNARKLFSGKLYESYGPPGALSHILTVELLKMETTIYDLSMYSVDISSPHSTALKRTPKRASTDPLKRRVSPVRDCNFSPDQTLVNELDTFLPRRTSTLRPLVLPMRLASLSVVLDRAKVPAYSLHATLSSKEKGPWAANYASDIMEPRRDCRSKGLDDIIALLDTCVSEFSQDLVQARRSIVSSDELWDENSLFAPYAI